MQLALVDQLIILGYLVIVMLLGVVLSRVASQGIEDYFLGGRTIPWWVLGASGTASNFDMTGTMAIVTAIYLLGYKGFWITLRGGAALPLAFILVYMGKWTRRSNVMTSAEWMIYRYGDGAQGKAARILSSAAYLIFSIGMVAYFCVGTGTFIQNLLLPEWSRTSCAMIMITIGLVYTLMSGLYGVVFTDMVQEVMITITAIYISVKAFFMFHEVSPQIPVGWTDFELPMKLTQLQDLPASYAEFEFFAACVIFWVGKGVLEGVGGLGGYMAQRYYAARNEREAGLMTAEWIVLLGFRWTMIAGLAIMGISLASSDPSVTTMLKANPESVLPLVLGKMLPVGLKGVAIAGFLAAAMSTFDSTVNAGASYWVIDIYQAFLHPEADQEELIRQSWWATILLTIVGVLLAAMVENINEVWGFITGALSAGLLIPLVLRWYWSRHNGYGFAWGTGVGMGVAMVLQVLETSGRIDLALYESMPLTCALGLLASIVATLMTEPTDQETLLYFYRTTRPGGFWSAQRAAISSRERMEITIEHLNDIIALVLALPWQMSLFFGCMAFIFHDWTKFVGCAVTWIFCTFGLYFFWYRQLRSPEETGEAAAEAEEIAQRNARLAAEDAARGVVDEPISTHSLRNPAPMSPDKAHSKDNLPSSSSLAARKNEAAASDSGPSQREQKRQAKAKKKKRNR